MLSKRTLLMTATGLLIGFITAAQTPNSSGNSSPSSLLFWLMLVALVVVLISALGTGASVVSATRRHQARQRANAPASAQSVGNETQEKGAIPC